MQQFEHIQSLWHSHTVDVKISADEMLSQAKKEVNSIKAKSVLTIVGMAAALFAIAIMWLFMDQNSWATHIALTIMISTIAIYTFILYRGYRLISKNDFTIHPNDFLAQLKLYQLSRFRLYNRLFWFYASALTLSIILYFFELSANFSLSVQILVIAGSLAWMLFCSTIVRKAVIKREKERLSLLIEKFTRISEQFEERS
jgi:membrane protein YdbS with pleckstrin-like domain